MTNQEFLDKKIQKGDKIMIKLNAGKLATYHILEIATIIQKEDDIYLFDVSSNIVAFPVSQITKIN